MTQPARTTETINRDNAAIRDIMHRIRELTVPDRATLAVGLIGHLATMMNRAQMSKLMQQLADEAERVQDVPPSRQRDKEEMEAAASTDQRGTDDRDDRQGGVAAAGGARPSDSRDTRPNSDMRASLNSEVSGARTGSSPRSDGDFRPEHGDARGRQGMTSRGDRGDTRNRDDRVGQAGRGEFRSETLL
jgi:hypothetical protein